MSSVNLRTIYAFAREMYPKNVATNIQYGTAGFRTRYLKKTRQVLRKSESNSLVDFVHGNEPS